jgi:hypothetical protein
LGNPGNPFDALIVGVTKTAIRVTFQESIPVRRELFAVLKILGTSRCPFASLPEPRRYRWDVGLTEANMANCR